MQIGKSRGFIVNDNASDEEKETDSKCCQFDSRSRVSEEPVGNDSARDNW